MDYITLLDIYEYAKRHRLLEARIRITDGEAVSYYPTMQCVERGVFELVIDVSPVQPVGFDDLDEYAKRMYGTR